MIVIKLAEFFKIILKNLDRYHNITHYMCIYIYFNSHLIHILINTKINNTLSEFSCKVEKNASFIQAS